jgi:hypothetical protein
MFEGLVAGAAQSIVDVPIEVVKTQFITGNKNIRAVLTVRRFHFTTHTPSIHIH